LMRFLADVRPLRVTTDESSSVRSSFHPPGHFLGHRWKIYPFLPRPARSLKDESFAAAAGESSTELVLGVLNLPTAARSRGVMQGDILSSFSHLLHHSAISLPPSFVDFLVFPLVRHLSPTLLLLPLLTHLLFRPTPYFEGHLYLLILVFFFFYRLPAKLVSG